MEHHQVSQLSTRFRLPLLGLVFVVVLRVLHGSETAEPSDLWRLVAKSHLIIVGTLKAPVTEIPSIIESGKHRYMELRVIGAASLKGPSTDAVTINWYTKPRTYKPTPQQVLALNDQKVLLFLVHVDDARFTGYFFADSTTESLQEFSEIRLKLVQDRVLEQRDALARFSDIFPPPAEPLYEEVRRLVDAMTQVDGQMPAFEQLEALGRKAVPAIVMLMDDRRDLAIPAISLRNNSPNAFEGVRHYGPEKIVDALAAILNQITGQSFGFIYNGGSELERQTTVNGWRLFLLQNVTRKTDYSQ